MTGGAAGQADSGQPRDPFAADVDGALDALVLAWGDDYDQIWLGLDGQWGAHRKDAGKDDVVTGASPDELNQAIRTREGTP